MTRTPKLVQVMIMKGGAYILIGLALFPGSLLVASGKFTAVLAVLSTFFSLAAALGFLASRTGIADPHAKRVLLIAGLIAVAFSIGQGVYGVRSVLSAAQAAQAAPQQQPSSSETSQQS